MTEYDEADWQHTNVFALGQLLATYSATGTPLTFALNDWLGTKRVQAKADGELDTSFLSLPYGDNEVTSGSGPNATEHFFTGKVRDSESGNDYFKYRYYSSSVGRWISPDPSGLQYANLADPQSLNLYGYVGDDPLTRADLMGLCWKGFAWACDLGKMIGRGFVAAYRWESKPTPHATVTTSQIEFIPDASSASNGKPQEAVPSKPTCTTGFGIGLTASADGTAGLGYGGGTNGSIGAGVFGGSNGLDAGAFASEGSAASALGHGAPVPSANLIGRFFLGLVSGAGGGVFITNASQADQLRGLSGTWTVDFGDFINGAGQLSAGTDSAGNNIWSFSFTIGGGFGAGVQSLTNKTKAVGIRGGC